MSDFIQYIMDNPVALVIAAALALLIVYFIIQKLLKLALICGLVLVALFGYYYITAPEEFPERVVETVQEVKTRTGGLVETGKVILEKGKKIAGQVADEAAEEAKDIAREENTVTED